jgi:hypothetical protein
MEVGYMRFSLKCLAAAALAAISPALAQQRLKPLGTAVYDPKPADALSYKFNLRPEDRFLRSLQVEADRGSGEVRDIVITYRDGEGERVHLHQKIREGATTAPVRVNPDRPVVSIEMTYIPDGPVQFVILSDGGPPPPPPPPPKPVAEWTELGCKSVGFLLDQDTIAVPSRDFYRALRLRSSGFDIEMRDMGVVFSNGQRDLYRINQVIPTGGRTGPIDLRGGQRNIREIQLTYSTRVLSNQKTKLCVDGLKSIP